jgi:NADH:ubiquinone oxidoreductase subunit F (NADH-binding)
VGELLEVIGIASLCGLGQMAPGPIRSAIHFWPELFA